MHKSRARQTFTVAEIPRRVRGRPTAQNSREKTRLGVASGRRFWFLSEAHARFTARRLIGLPRLARP
jgi:hypothetical protein